MVVYKELSEITSGTRTSIRQVGDGMTSEDLWDTYVHVPGAKAIINRPIEAMFHNGFRDWDIDYERKLELEKAIKWRNLFGFSAIVMEGDDIQAWNPKIQGIGFTLAEWDEKTGQCIGIKIYTDAQQGNVGKLIKGREKKFFLFRTPDGLPGERGISDIIDLVDVCRISFEIWAEYAKYAFHQGLAHPVLKVTDLDDEKFTKADAALNAPTKDDAVIIDAEDDFSYASPQSQAYDPVPMLEYGDTYITRESSLNKLQLYGDPTGALAASETSTSNWYAHIKELQDEIMPSLKPVLIALGAPDDVMFNEPGEYNIATQMNGVLQIRMALDGLVPPEQIVNIINKYMANSDKDKLRPLTDEEKDKEMKRKLPSDGDERNPMGEDKSKPGGNRDNRKKPK